MTLIPLVLFFVLLYIGRDDLGLKGITISVFVALGLFLVMRLAEGWVSMVPVAGFALLDIVLLLYIFGGDISSRRF